MNRDKFFNLSNKDKVVNEVNTIVSNNNNNSANKIIPFVAFFKKLPIFIGRIVILIFITSLIKYLFQIYSINIMDSYYIKIFCILGIIIISILALDYLLKFFIFCYLKKNQNLIISNKLPKLIFKYLTTTLRTNNKWSR